MNSVYIALQLPDITPLLLGSEGTKVDITIQKGCPLFPSADSKEKSISYRFQVLLNDITCSKKSFEYPDELISDINACASDSGR
jgi:hypothetical protein